MRTETSSSPRLALAALALLTLASTGCEEEMPVILTERIALLPDGSGYLSKEVRARSKDETELAIREVVGGTSRDLFLAPLKDFQDVKFAFAITGDTIRLFHAQPLLDGALKPVEKSAHAIRVEPALPSTVSWLTAGTQEGDAIFYAPDRWKAFLEISRKP